MNLKPIILFKNGAHADNIRNFLHLYDEINAVLKEDTELVNLFRSQLTDTCYPDPELKTLTVDVGFYIARNCSQKDLAARVEPDKEDCRYWWLNANPRIWSFADIAVGEVQFYTLYNDVQHRGIKLPHE